MAVPVYYTHASSGMPDLTGLSPSGVLFLDHILTNNNYEIVDTNGSNKRVYRTLNMTAPRPYIRAEDAGSYVKLRTGEGYTDIDTLTNPCPTVAQSAVGFCLHKSNAADESTRQFAAYVTDRGFCVFNKHTPGTTLHYALTYIGEYETRLSAEIGLYDWVCIGSTSTTAAITSLTEGTQFKITANPQLWIPRAKTLAIGAQVASADNLSGTLLGSAGHLGVPPQGDRESDLISGGLLGPVALYIIEPNNVRSIRGRLLGIWETNWSSSDATAAPPDPITSTDYPGRSWKMFRHNASTGGNWLVETTDWHAGLIAQEVT